MSVAKDMRKLRREAEGEGWTVTPSRGGHVRWQAPSGAVVFSSSSMSDQRGIKNHLSILRRFGFRGGRR